TPELIPRMIERSQEIVEEVDAYPTDQFRNRDMIDGYAALGHELLDQLDGPAGCFVGGPRVLRSALPDVRRVAIEPAESPVLSGGAAGTHRIEGGGTGFWPAPLGRGDPDEVIPGSPAALFPM